MRRALTFAARPFVALVRRFRGDRSGVAAVEFATIVPVMFSLLVGTIEFSQALTVDRRVTQAASSSADLVARSPASGMTPAEVDGALRIIEQLIAPYDLSRLNVKIVSVRARTSGGGLNYTVDWSRNNLGQTPHTAGSTFNDIPTGLLVAGETVIVAEATYNYVPLIFRYFITSAFDLKEKFYLKPRNASCVILKTVMTTCAQV